MAKNEAKIKFTAETGQFNSSIKTANDTLSKLKAELKLNETQAKATGETAESLGEKHQILKQEYDAASQKVEALNSKLNVAVKYYGENSSEVMKLQRQVANAKTEQERLGQAVEKCANDIKQFADAATKAESASEKLGSAISDQEDELSALKREYVDLVLEQKEGTDEAQELAQKINKLSGELKDNKSSLEDAAKQADSFDQSLSDAGNGADSASDGFTVMKGVIADLASQAIQMAIGKISEFISYLAELPEATRELRQDLTTLDTAFQSSGHSTETATKTWKELYRVIGEDDRAVETANHLAKLTDNEKELEQWTRILTGVYGTYQDSLPIEGLAEAANETVKTGQVTGVFADTLNWSSEAAKMFSKYMNEDVTTAEDAFNVALSKCTTEQERQALITDTLTTLYGDAAAKYEEAAGSQLDAKEATAENALAQAELANAIEPVTTAWQGLKTELLVGITPVIEKVSGLMLDALSWAREHPIVIQAIATTVGILAGALGIAAIALGVYTAAQWAMNTALLANPITWVVAGIVAAIAVIAGIVVLVVGYWDEIKAKTLEIWNGIKTSISDACSAIWEKIQATWNWITTTFSNISAWINDNVVQPVINFFTGMWTSIQEIWTNITTAVSNAWTWICNVVQTGIMLVGSILSAAFQIITLPFRFIWENCKETVFAAWNWIKQSVSTAINAVKTVITNAWNAIKAVTTPVWNTIKTFIATIWNNIKTNVTTAINAVKSVVYTVWNAIKSATSTAWNAIKSVVSTVWNSIKLAVTTAINAVKSVVSSVWNSVKSVTLSIWNGIKSTISSVWNGIKSGVLSAANGVKSVVSSVFNGIRSTATSVWNGIKNAIITPINAAKNGVKSAIDSIKGWFSGLKLKLPHIKLPHFKISGSLSMSPPSVPKLSISWYKEGGIMMKPTIFGALGNTLLGGGEAGAEAIAPIDKLSGYVSEAVASQLGALNINRLADAVEALASRPVNISVNGKTFAQATMGDIDNVSGLRTTFKDRGLVF